MPNIARCVLSTCILASAMFSPPASFRALADAPRERISGADVGETTWRFLDQSRIAREKHGHDSEKFARELHRLEHAYYQALGMEDLSALLTSLRVKYGNPPLVHLEFSSDRPSVLIDRSAWRYRASTQDSHLELTMWLDPGRYSHLSPATVSACLITASHDDTVAARLARGPQSGISLPVTKEGPATYVTRIALRPNPGRSTVLRIDAPIEAGWATELRIDLSPILRSPGPTTLFNPEYPLAAESPARPAATSTPPSHSGS